MKAEISCFDSIVLLFLNGSNQAKGTEQSSNQDYPRYHDNYNYYSISTEEVSYTVRKLYS